MLEDILNTVMDFYHVLSGLTGLSETGLILLTIVLGFVIAFIRSYNKTIDRMYPHN